MPPMLRWTRIEPNARSIAMESGLRAEVADAAWFLARQWQLGEFRGEDAGSPVRTHLEMECTPLTRYLSGGVQAAWFTSSSLPPTAPGQRIDSTIPLETLVEREYVRVDPLHQSKLSAEAGLQFLRLLAASGLGTHRRTVTAMCALEAPTNAPDPSTARFMLVMAGRVPDGTLLSFVLDIVDAAMTIDVVPDAARARVGAGVSTWNRWVSTLTAADRARLEMVVQSWRHWKASLFREPDGTTSSWIPERLEYEFAVSSPTPLREVVLTAPEYAEGRLDWYSFDSLARGSLGARREDMRADDIAREVVHRVAIPTPVRYPGMPRTRYWEFEDAQVDFGALPVDPQRLAQMILVEFALIAGDDWFVIPVDMAVGSVARVRWLVVTDTFGERTLVNSARVLDSAGGRPPVWDMFHLQPDVRQRAMPTDRDSDVFLLPAALGTSLHGKAVEEVVLLRDEMANMAWAVERTVESAIGQPLDRAEAAHRRAAAPSAPAPATASGEPPPLSYRLSTDVPAHWLPLFPVRIRHDAAPVRLRRGGTPQGRILEPHGTAGEPLFINEEEVPREGARVTRTYQYARWIDGSTHLWIGRRKRPGRGEGSSGLRFDILESPR